MPKYTQANRALAVDTPLGTDKLLLIGFHGTDGISELFRYRLDLIAENETEIAFDSLLGQSCTVTVRWGKDNAKQRFFNGICTRVSQGERDTVFTRYHMELAPTVWLLSRKAQSRIFQRLSVPDILKKVLTGFKVTLNLSGFQPRDYCVQYRETDFNFACRLMEEEGIFYFFKHENGNHTMIVSNTSDSFESVPVQSSVPYEEKFGGTRPELRIDEWEKAQQLRSGKYTLWDHCFELPHKHLEAEKLIQDSVSVGSVTHKLKVANNEKLEIYDFPGEYAQRFDGIDKGGGEQPDELKKIFEDNKRTVGIRMQQEAVESLEIEGRSNCRQFVSGHKFTLERHFNANGEYVLTGVTHSVNAAIADYRSGLGESSPYVNKFRCIPVALPYRPPRVTPKPIVQGTQSAVVVGPPGEEIFTDKYSRVKVQFHWDREGKNDPDSSCWIRVATLWAGKQWGMIHIPRIGQEVLVDFLEGDPDQPVIVGSVYNADMMPPGKLPASKIGSGVKSRSTLNGTPENFNAIEFDDTKGKEALWIHAEKDQNVEVEHDESYSVGNDRSTTIGHDDTLTIENKQTTTVQKGPSQLYVKANNREVIVDQQYYMLAHEIYEEATDSSATLKASTDVGIYGGASVNVQSGDANYLLIKQGGDIAVNAAKKIEQGVAGNTIKISDDGKISISAGVEIELKVGSSSVKVHGSDVTIDTPTINLNGITIDKAFQIKGTFLKLN